MPHCRRNSVLSLMMLLQMSRKNNEWAKGQVVEIRATIEHIHHSKADSALVATKAEREYVDNALEKLMREVEQVLNASNAGLIDTLDKSLNILRDMIDGKATKQGRCQAAKTQSRKSTRIMLRRGFLGYHGYRCLGCNRVMDTMRPRPMGGNFSAFINRLPNSPRAPPRVATAGTSATPAGYLTEPPKSS